MTTDPQDAALARQLRFALVLQGFAALMMGGAAVVRIGAFGLDVLSVILVLAFALIGLAGYFTWRRLKTLTNGETPV
jgi:hypothetical protein